MQKTKKRIGNKYASSSRMVFIKKKSTHHKHSTEQTIYHYFYQVQSFQLKVNSNQRNSYFKIKEYFAVLVIKMA